MLVVAGMSFAAAMNAQTASYVTPVANSRALPDISSPSYPVWKWSLAIMTAANAADAITSIQCNQDPARCGYERGLLYAGAKFSIGVKAAVVGGQMLAQWLAVRKRPKAMKWFVPGNVAQAGTGAWAAWHNARLR
ncbi:MAG: hypothetical protein ACLPY2_10345 [Bryobacteraceae bacterium]